MRWGWGGDFEGAYIVHVVCSAWGEGCSGVVTLRVPTCTVYEIGAGVGWGGDLEGVYMYTVWGGGWSGVATVRVPTCTVYEEGAGVGCWPWGCLHVQCMRREGGLGWGGDLEGAYMYSVWGELGWGGDLEGAYMYSVWGGGWGGVVTWGCLHVQCMNGGLGWGGDPEGAYMYSVWGWRGLGWGGDLEGAYMYSVWGWGGAGWYIYSNEILGRPCHWEDWIMFFL